MTELPQLSFFEAVSDHEGARPDGVYKATLFRSGRLLLGLNCLEPGQRQKPHDHEGQDKFYYVVRGSGEFTVGESTQEADAGTAVWAPAGVGHSVANTGDERLVLLVGLSPAPGE